jgi:hypothetical protein
MMSPAKLNITMLQVAEELPSGDPALLGIAPTKIDREIKKMIE